MPVWSLDGSSAMYGSGVGSTSDYCAYNASSDRLYEAKNVKAAKDKIKAVEAKIENLEKKLDRLDCEDCEEVVYKILETMLSIDDSETVDSYIDYLSGGNQCSVMSYVDEYNYYAIINGWDFIPQYNSQDMNPDRMIAGGTSTASPPATPSPRPVPKPVQEETPPPSEVGGGTPPPVDEEVPVEVVSPAPPAPQNCLKWGGPNNTINYKICYEKYDNNSNILNAKEQKKCVSCLKPTGRNKSGEYGDCLQEKLKIEEEIAILEDELEDLEDDLADAEANPSSDTVCADCMKDTRSSWSKYGAPILAGALTLGAAYWTYKKESDAYDDYTTQLNQIYEDNNAKGYPSDPYFKENLSGYRAATVLVNGLPMVINTGLASGAFGCSGSSIFGSGAVTSGIFSGSQSGGTTGIPSILSGLSGQAGVSGGLYTNSGSGPWGAGTGSMGTIGNGNMGTMTPFFPGNGSGQMGTVYNPNGYGQVGVNGGMGSVMTDPQALQQQMLQLEQQRAYINQQYDLINQQQAWAGSYQSLTQNYQQQVQALGAYPSGNVYAGAGGGAGFGVGLGGNIYSGQTNTGVMAPYASSTGLSGYLNAGFGLGVSTGPSNYVMQQPQLGGFNTGTIYNNNGTAGATYNQGQVFNPNTTAPTTTQPSNMGLPASF